MITLQRRRHPVRLPVAGGLALALWVVAAVLQQPIHAGNCSWTGHISSEWTVPGNWGSGCTGVNGIPSAADTVDIPESGVLYEPSIGGDIMLQGLTIQHPRVLSLSANITLDTPLTNYSTLSLGTRTLTYVGSGFTNYGSVTGTGAVRTQGTVSLYLPGQSFSPSLEVVSGMTTVSGNLDGSTTVQSGATLQVAQFGGVDIEADLTVNGTLSGEAETTSVIYFHGNTLANNGIISLSNLWLWSSDPQSITGTGSWTGNGDFRNDTSASLANDMSMAFSRFLFYDDFSLNGHLLTFTSPSSLSIDVGFSGGPVSEFDIGDHPLTISAPEGSSLTNLGYVTGMGPVRTAGTVNLHSYTVGQQFDPPLEVVSGVTTAGGTFSGDITIANGAMLQIEASGMVRAYDDVIVNGILSGGAGNSIVYFEGSTLTNNGAISLPNILFLGSGPQIITGSGSWTGNGEFNVQGSAGVSLANDVSMAFRTFLFYRDFSLNNHLLTFTSPSSLSISVGYSGGQWPAEFDIGNQPLTINASERTSFANYGYVTGTGPVRTQGTVSLLSHSAGQIFDPPLEIVSGTTTASGLLHGSVTVYSGATLQVGGGTHDLSLWDSLTINGTLSGDTANSNIYFYGTTLTNNGAISVPHFDFYDTHTLAGIGSFIDNMATIHSGATVTLGSDHEVSNLIVYGSLATPAVLLDISGDFTNNGTYTHGNGTLRFDGGAIQNLVLNVPSTFYNLAVASGTTLVETVAADNASVAGTLTNDGVIRKTRSVSGAGALSFGLTGVSMNVTTAGSLSQVQVDRIDRDHPNANVLTATGRYWTITPIGAGYTVDLTLLRPASVPANALVCRSETSEWNCAYSASTVTTVTQAGITELSDWTVGIGADVTSVQDVAGRWGTSAGGPDFDPLFDMDRNGVIDIRDVMLVTSLWNAGG